MAACNGVSPDLVSELWVVLDGIDDWVEDPDEDDGRKGITLEDTPAEFEALGCP